MASTLTPDEQVHVDALTDAYGRGWDDSTDLADRYADYAPEYTDAPTVERVTRKGPDHVPGSAWSGTACLCSCHYGARSSAGAPACDERDCKAWGQQNQARVARTHEQRAVAKARRLARKAKSA